MVGNMRKRKKGKKRQRKRRKPSPWLWKTFLNSLRKVPRGAQVKTDGLATTVERRGTSSGIALRHLSHPRLHVRSAKDHTGRETAPRGVGLPGRTLKTIRTEWILCDALVLSFSWVLEEESDESWGWLENVCKQQHCKIYLRDALGPQSLSQMFQPGHLRTALVLMTDTSPDSQVLAYACWT